jgi:hypothetical protein
MFCQKCGVSASEESDICLVCGFELRAGPRISNKAMLLAAIAAAVSLGTALLSFSPRGKTPAAQVDQSIEPAEPIAMSAAAPSATPTPEPSPSPAPTRSPEPAAPSPTIAPIPTIAPALAQRPFLMTSPSDGFVFPPYHPRRLKLSWLFLGGAAEYKVTVEMGAQDAPGWWPYREANVSGPPYTLDFVGAKRGRWRITPILSDGQSGPPSDWLTFQFSQ